MPKSDPARFIALPVPLWEQLPAAAQTELSAAGYGKPWFEKHADAPALRLTVLNLYVKLRGLGLWRFVAREADTGDGALNFVCSDVAGLKRAVKERADITNPEDAAAEWSCREKGAVNALHFKHFKGWPDTQVQAHIDPRGMLMGNLLWWAVPVVPLAVMALHGLDPTGYQDVAHIRDLLLKHGAERALLCAPAR